MRSFLDQEVFRGRIFVVVHSFCALLAPGRAGAHCLPLCVAAESAIPDRRYHPRRSVRSAARDFSLAGALVARPASALKCRRADPPSGRCRPSKQAESAVNHGFLGTS